MWQTGKRGNHQRREQEGRHAGEQRETTAGEQTPSQRAQKRRGKERKHQTLTFKSHQRIMEYCYIGSFIHHNGSASGEPKEFRLSGQLNIDHA